MDSDFMARYLPPENTDRREPAPPAQEDTKEPKMTWPTEPPPPQVHEPAAPETAVPSTAHHDEAPPPADPFTPAPPARSAPTPVAVPPRSAAPPPPAAQRPATGHQPGAPNNGVGGPHRDAGAAWLSAGHHDPRAATPNGAARWAPRVDAATPPPAAPEYIRVDELAKQRRIPPETGWRKAVYVSSGHLLNFGAGPAERKLRDDRTRIAANIPGNYQIAAVCVKGGVGKTRAVAGIGSVFGLFRTEPVIAIDASPTYGCLGRLVDPAATASMREFLADNEMNGYPRARHYTGKNREGLEVLAGNQNVANPLALSSEMFAAALSRTRRFYQLALVDCGPQIEHPVMPGILSSADSLMIIGTMNIDGGLAAEQTIDWLAARNGHELLKRSVVVLNDVYQCHDKKFVAHVVNRLGPRVGAVKTIPWDEHLRDGATLDFEALQRPTQLAFIDLAAELARGFPTAGALTR